MSEQFDTKAYRMPAEWSRHAATWMSWPFDDEMWFGHLAQVRQEYAGLVRAICACEPVHLLLRDEECAASAAAMLEGVGGVTMHRLLLDDVWLRDNGAIFVARRSELASAAQPPLLALNWRFNAWGEKYLFDHDDQAPLVMAKYLAVPRVDIAMVFEGGSIDVNGQGLALTTAQCLLEPQRNPGMTQAAIDAAVRGYLGLEDLIWLDQGLEGDHTDGHIDTITRFASERTVLTSVTADQSDVNFARMQANLQQLRAYRDKSGRSLEVIELPLPRQRLYLEDGTRLAPSYANFYICNGAVLVPQYGDAEDEHALAVIGKAMPGRRVVGLPSRHIIMGGGSFHCLTQQQPALPG